VDRIFEFDNEAFGISKREAECMDPQQKMLLEVSLAALEDSGIKYNGSRTGVYVGVGMEEQYGVAAHDRDTITSYSITGCTLSINANRISFVFNLHGPSMSIDTACSSSVTAFHEACKAIRDGDCDQALVGGVNMILDPTVMIEFSKLGVLSPNGRCRSFDQGADGYVRSEGCGVVIIKPLEAALRDGDHIYCVVRGSACNSDGKRSPSLTMPNGDAQQEAFRRAAQQAGINPRSVFYVEAHATGTKVGDPIEANSIGEVFGGERSDILRVGSVKANVGHLECASFMAGLIKATLMLDKGCLVPNINFETPNPDIKWDEHKLRVQTEVEKFDSAGKLMAISSFGFGGSNGCVIVEGVGRTTPAKLSQFPFTLNAPYLYVLSAETSKALETRVEQAKALTFSTEADNAMTPRNLSATLMRRQLQRYISLGVGATPASAVFSDPKPTSQREPLVWVFGGQGPQHAEMGRQLYQLFPAFRQAIDKCDSIFKAVSGYSLVEDIGVFGATRGDPNAVHNLKHTLPSLIFLQIALIDLWKSLGITPSAVVGHSFGEMAAAYAANSCSLNQIVEVAYYRSKLLEKLDGKGTMIAIGASPEVIEPWLASEDGNPENQRAWIAAYNSPESVTVGGYPDAIHKLAAKCQEKKIFNRILKINNAYHTPIMSAVRDEALALFGRTLHETHTPSIPLFSTVYGTWQTEKFSADYMWLNIERPVRFRAAVQGCIERFGPDTIFLELTAHPVLGTNIKQSGGKTSLFSLHREQPEQNAVLNAVGTLMSYNYNINIDGLMGTETPVVPLHNNVLPYPHLNTVCWKEDKDHLMNRIIPEGMYSTLLGVKQQHPESDTWATRLAVKKHKWIADHVVQDAIVFPGAGYVEMAMEALNTTSLTNITIGRVLTLTDSDYRDARITINRGEDKTVRVFSKPDQWDDVEWVLHASAQPATTPSDADDSWIQAIQSEVAKTSRTFNKRECYDRFKSINLAYGHFFQGIVNSGQVSDKTGFAEVDVSHLDNAFEDDFKLHPAVLDICFQAMLSSFKNLSTTFVPVHIDRIDWYDAEDLQGRHDTPVTKKPTRKFTVYSRTSPVTTAGHPEGSLQGDLIAYDTENKRVIGRVSGVIVAPVGSAEVIEQKNFTVKWQSWELPAPESALLPPVLDVPDMLEASKLEKAFDLACVSYIGKALKSLPPRLVETAQPHRQRYIAWCNELVQSRLAEVTATAETDIDNVRVMATEAEAVKRVGENFLQLLKDPLMAQKLLFTDDLMERLYKSTTFMPYVKELATLVGSTVNNIIAQSGDKDRVIRILEVGAGTGVLTREVLKMLDGKANFKYTFTDISQKFLKDAQQMFPDHPNVEYKILNLNKEIASQGLDAKSVDIVLAFNVLHITSDVNLALTQIKHLLVPNGLFMAIEPTRPSVWFNMYFGLFREWWGFTDVETRPKHCALSREGWTQVLNTQEFTNVSVATDASEVCHSIIVGQTQPATYKTEAPHANGEANGHTNGEPNGLANGHTASHEYHKFRGTVEELLHKSQEWIVNAEQPQTLFVITHGAQPVPNKTGSAVVTSSKDAPLIGFTRSLASEYPSHNIFLVDFANETTHETEKLWIKRIHQLVNAKEFSDHEIAIRDDKIWVPKFKQVTRDPSAPLSKSANLDGTNFKLVIGTRGQLNTLQFVEVTSTSSLGEQDVLVDVRAAALNFKDLMLALGMITVPAKNGGLKPVELGLEFSGEVVAVGSGVTDLKKGDQVFGIGNECLANRIKVSRELLVKKPEHMTHVQAASIPIVFATSYAALISKSRLQAGETVLIHSGAGGIGQSSIQLAKHVGAEVIATVSSEDKRKFLTEKYGVTKFSDSRDHTVWSKDVKKMTNGEGVDVVLNSLKGKAIECGLKSLNLGGRFIEIGKVDILGNSSLGLAPFLKDLSFFSVQLDILMDDTRGTRFVRRCLEDVAKLAESKSISPIVDKVFGARDIEQAFRYLMSGKHLGKIIVDFDRAQWPNSQNVKRSVFHPETLYVISGGLGAVGWETVKLMSNEGATRFLLLSRQGPAALSESQKEDLAALQARGVRVLVQKADVAKQADVKAAYDEARKQGLLTSRVGILHMAMALQDMAVKNMDEKSLHGALDCKIDGGRNLIESFNPADNTVDFVVLFSSISSVFGNADQANYAAGNSYLDQYAFELRSRGFKRVSVLNLSAVEDVGVLAEDYKKRQILRLRGVSSGLTSKQVFEQIRLMVSEESVVQWVFGNFNFKHLGEQFPFMKSKVEHLIDYRAHHDSGDGTGETAVSVESLTRLVAKLFGIEPSSINPAAPLTQLGLDSLLSVELSSNLKKTFDIKLSQMELLGGLSIEKILERASK
jgi:acyl transferase domain-containing protein/NADPH:quinone reductase-like Zn-dependent oxidoreductase/NAD(P)-dependent dehydrogenase (short-subunit alcohol dehydrogenase family)/SAM-dependent methyltransferase/acyl carrier protein